jgi:hypothetical protein
MLGGICNLKWKLVKKLGQRQQLQFTGIEWHSKFGSSLCKIHWSKHLWAFVKVVERSEIYNFGIIILGHFSSSFQSYLRSNRGSRNGLTPERDVAPRYQVLARQSAPPRVAAVVPPYSHAEVCLWSPVRAPRFGWCISLPRGASTRTKPAALPFFRRSIRHLPCHARPPRPATVPTREP